MALGYVRQSAGTIVTGNTILASDFNNEYNALLGAFDATTGHNHDGTVGGGAKIVASAITGLTIGTTGILSQTSATNITGRTLTGTSNRVTITNGDGVSGNPTVDISASYVGQATITTVGTITTGTWSGLFGAVSGANLTSLTAANISAGTAGINISGNAATVTTNANLTGAITSAGNATSLGSFTSLQLATALTDETGSGANVFATSPTLVTPILGTPTSGTLTNCTGLPMTTGVTGILAGTNGGTGVNNGASTITIAGNVTHAGAFTQTFTATANTSVTLPTSGTLYGTLANSITSAQLISSITDETGTGSLVFATSPTLVTPNLGTPSTLVATNATGTATGLTSGITNALKSATTTVDVSAATAPTAGQVLTATSSTAATWQNAGVFTLSYTSADQTITSAGALTLAHSLGSTPKLVQAYLICVTGELGYTAGDIVLASHTFNDQTASIRLNATNILIRFGSSASAYIVTRADNGNGAGITNANWNLRIKAWA